MNEYYYYKNYNQKVHHEYGKNMRNGARRRINATAW